MNILVINLTRFGDQLQSAAAVRHLAHKTHGRGGRLGIVCLEHFLPGALLLPGVDMIYPLSAHKFIHALQGGPGETLTRPASAWLAGVAATQGWVDKVREDFQPDEVLNLSATVTSCLLARMVAGDAPVNGFALDDEGFSRNSFPWSVFLQGSSACRATCPFNIVDLFRKMAGDDSLTPDASLNPPDQAARDAALDLIGPPGAKGFVALQLGASADIRRWPVASFVQVGDALWERHGLRPVLVGVASETALGEEYAAAARHPFVNCIGRTGITELAALLSHCAMLVSNDTGTLHLASGLGAPVLGLFLATAQPWDTGPYAPDNCALEPDLDCHPCEFSSSCPHGHTCRDSIRPETVLGLISSRLASGSWVPQEPVTGARAWLTTRDPAGYADLRSLSGHEEDFRTGWFRVQRDVFGQFFDARSGEPFAPDHPGVAIPCPAELGAAFVEGFSLLEVLCVQAEMLTRGGAPTIGDKFAKGWTRLKQVLDSRPEFTAIGLLLRAETDQGEDLAEMVPLLRRYRDLFSAFLARLTIPS